MDERGPYTAPPKWKLEHVEELVMRGKNKRETNDQAGNTSYPYGADAAWAYHGTIEVDARIWHEFLYPQRNTPKGWLVQSSEDDEGNVFWWWTQNEGWRREGKAWWWGFQGKQEETGLNFEMDED